MTFDRSGLLALLSSFGTAGVCVATAALVPSLDGYLPWHPGEPVPVVRVLAPQRGARVVETASGDLEVAIAPPPAALAVVPAATVPGGPTTARPPGVPTALVDADSRGMDAFYRALAEAETGRGLARASQWGDSTIAADGISGTVRRRLQDRYGNGGPGYLSAGLDPQWSMRLDVAVVRKGEWTTQSLLNGGGEARYGFGGIVSTAAADASVSFYAPKGSDGKRIPMHRFEVYYQANPAGVSWWSALSGRGAGGGSANAAAAVDRFSAADRPDGYTSASIGASADGPATFYGIVMETAGPGVVWDALGVVGVGTRSFVQSGRKHLAAQVARRKPDLTVVMLGGNELGLPSLLKGDPTEYAGQYADTLGRLRAGAPEAGCLIVTPLDQGTRSGGAPRSKPGLAAAIAAERAVADAWGCAFWDAQAAMGGPDSIVRWAALRPPLAWSDLLHLSETGQDIIGQLLADAIDAGYTAWKAKGGTSRPRPPPPGPPRAPAAPAPLPEASSP